MQALRKSSQQHSERGAIMVFFALLLPVLFGFMGLAIDFGLAYVQKGKMQDIADAAALAAAAHLSDGDERLDNIKVSVQKYAQANGLNVQDGELRLKESNAAWDTLDTPGSSQEFAVAYGIVTVTTDDEERERVRVRITRRVPTFFLRVLGDEFKDGLLVSAKAAAEGQGVAVQEPEEEEDEKVVDGPKINTGRINIWNGITENSIIISPGFDFAVYGGSCTLYNELKYIPGNGDVYGGDGQSGYVGDRYYYAVNNQINNSEEDNKIIKEAQQKLENAYTKVNSKILDVINDRESYISGVGSDGNDNHKRYIGHNDQWQIINTIKDTDTEIDLYMDGSYFTNWVGDYHSVLTNTALKNVKKINNLYLMRGYMGIIATENITYGNVFGGNSSSKMHVYVAGKNNTFEKYVYSYDYLSLGGSSNRFLCYEEKELGLGGVYGYEQVNVGETTDVTEVFYEGKTIPEANLNTRQCGSDSNWHVYFGSDSSNDDSSGSNSNNSSNNNSSNNTSGSGTTTTGGNTHLRLVE